MDCWIQIKIKNEPKQEYIIKREKNNKVQNNFQYGGYETNITDRRTSFIAPNIIDGKYTSIEHYLDVQFRLLHEDFLRPLRADINEYRDYKNKSIQERRFMNLNCFVYDNVTIIDVE